MKRLSAWVKKQQRQSARRPRLDDALLGRRPIAYIAHRLRFVTLRVALRTALHIVEVVALAQVFSPRYLGPILFLRHSTLLFSSLYWGALETQRIALRQAWKRHDAAEFGNVAGRFNAAALVVVFGAQTMIAGSLWFSTRQATGLSIYDAYAIACGLRLGLDTWSRTQHSLVFSVARVRRPLLSMVLIDVIEVFGLLVAWLQIGAFAFALMLVVTGALRAAMTLWFAQKTREQLKLTKPGRPIWREFSRGGWRQLPLLQALKFAWFNASLQIDSLAIMLLSTGVAGDDGIQLSLSLHAFAPLLGAGFAWTRVFYFDFVRLGSSVCPLLTERLGRLLDRVALLYPLVLVALVLPIAAWLVPELLATTPGLLVGFVVARSLFALRQMEAYSYAAHRTQLRQGLVLVLSVTAMVPFVHRTDVLLIWASCALALAALLGGRARVTRPALEAGASLCFEQFAHWLSTQAQPIRLIWLEIDRRMTSMGKVRSALLLAGLDGPQLQPSHHQLILALPTCLNVSEARSRIMVATAGSVTGMQVGDPVASCFEACSWLCQNGRLGEQFRQAGFALARTELRPKTIESLSTEFEQQFPDGVRLTGASGNIRGFGAAARGDLHDVLAAINANHPMRPRRARHVEVAVYRTKGEASQLFVLSRSSARVPAFAEFRQRVSMASKLASLKEVLGETLHDE